MCIRDSIMSDHLCIVTTIVSSVPLKQRNSLLNDRDIDTHNINNTVFNKHTRICLLYTSSHYTGPSIALNFTNIFFFMQIYEDNFICCVIELSFTEFSVIFHHTVPQMFCSVAIFSNYQRLTVTQRYVPACGYRTSLLPRGAYFLMCRNNKLL